MQYIYVFPPTLTERKSPTFGAKDLSWLQTSARKAPLSIYWDSGTYAWVLAHAFLLLFHAFLTHLPLVSSFRLSFTSSASNAFFCQFAVLRTGKLSSFYVKKKRPLGLGSSHPIYLPGNVLLLRNVSPTTIGAKELNFCVRHGNRCDLLAIVTRQCHV